MQKAALALGAQTQYPRTSPLPCTPAPMPSRSLTRAALAVGQDVLQPLLQLIGPLPLQMQLPLEVLELWGTGGKRRAEALWSHGQGGHAWPSPHHTAALPFFSKIRCPSTVSFSSCGAEKAGLVAAGRAVCSALPPQARTLHGDPGCVWDGGGWGETRDLFQVADGLQVAVPLLLGLLELIPHAL